MCYPYTSTDFERNVFLIPMDISHLHFAFDQLRRVGFNILRCIGAGDVEVADLMRILRLF